MRHPEESQHIRIESDLTPGGTKVFAPNGDEIKGVCRVAFHAIEQNSIPMATITFYVQPFLAALNKVVIDARSRRTQKEEPIP